MVISGFQGAVNLDPHLWRRPGNRVNLGELGGECVERKARRLVARMR